MAATRSRLGEREIGDGEIGVDRHAGHALLDRKWSSVSLERENPGLDHQPWVLQFLSTWDEFGVCFESRGEAKLWGDAREGPLYGCPSHDVVYRKRLVERFPKRFVDIQRI